MHSSPRTMVNWVSNEFMRVEIFHSERNRFLMPLSRASVVVAPPLQVDYLTPFLQHVGDVHNISAADAQRARDACLRALKDRLLVSRRIVPSFPFDARGHVQSTTV